MTSLIRENPTRTLPIVVQELAEKFRNAPALLSDHECWTYQQLAERMNRYARWALDRNIGRGDVVALLMPSRPEYMAVWLGITAVGNLPKSTAWILIRAYYAAFFAAHSILRMFGNLCIQLESPETFALDHVAQSFVQNGLGARHSHGQRCGEKTN